MSFHVVYKPLAQIEVLEAFQWYGQPHIGMGNAFLAELERTNGFISSNPQLYPAVEAEIRRANLSLRRHRERSVAIHDPWVAALHSQ